MRTVGDVEAWGTGGPDYSSYLDYYGGVPFVEEGTIETAGTPVIIDIRASLGHNAHVGSIINNGPGILYVYLSSDGISYSDAIELNPNQLYDLTKEDVNKIKLDSDTSGNAYKIVAH